MPANWVVIFEISGKVFRKSAFNICNSSFPYFILCIYVCMYERIKCENINNFVVILLVQVNSIIKARLTASSFRIIVQIVLKLVCAL